MSDMQTLTARAEALIGELTSALMSTVEVAAERLHLAAEVAKVQQRMAAFAAVLEAIAAQKAALIDRQQTATGPMRTLLARQLELLTAQELAVLERAGAPAEAARQAVAALDAPTASPRSNGRRLAHVNGNGK